MKIVHIILLLGLLAACTPNSKQVKGGSRIAPNVLFILTDDQGIGDLSLHGNDSLDTPNTDRLLLESHRFTRFYVNPVCAPTRAAFLSGQYPQRTGALFVTRRAETMTDSVLTIAELLAANGYRTGLFGKWHNGATFPYNPPGQGFQEFLGFSMGHYNRYYNDVLENENGQLIPFSGYLTDVLTDTAATFMTQSEAPFFCMLTYQAPHTPIQAPDSLFRKYLGRGLTTYNAGIYAMIEANDLAIGRLLRQLEQTRQLANTIIIFATDNGPNGDRYRMGLRGTKGQVDEGGVRVPFALFVGEDIQSSKGILKRSIIDQPAAHLDLLPTLLDLLDITPPSNLQTLDGKSLVPLLAGEQTTWADRPLYVVKQGLPFVHYPGGFRTDRYLYLLRQPGEHEVYDLQSDPGQQLNLYDSTQRQHQEFVDQYLAFANNLSRPERVAPPIQIGHNKVAELRLLAHEGQPFGKAAFHDQYGWANDWVEGIDAPGSGISWPIKVVKPGQYQFRLNYATTTPKGELEIVLRSNLQNTKITADSYLNQDTATKDLVERKEVYPREWNSIEGSIQLTDDDKVLSVSLTTESENKLLVKSLVLLAAE